MMRILVTANTAWYLWNFRAEFIKHLLDQDHEVVCLAPKDEYSSKLEGLGAKMVHVTMDQTGSNPLKIFLAVPLIYRKWQ